jgi:hypothetical protein
VEVGVFRGSGLICQLISSIIYVVESCGVGLRMREGFVLFMEYLSHSQYNLSRVRDVW